DHFQLRPDPLCDRVARQGVERSLPFVDQMHEIRQGDLLVRQNFPKRSTPRARHLRMKPGAVSATLIDIVAGKPASVRSRTARGRHEDPLPSLFPHWWRQARLANAAAQDTYALFSPTVTAYRSDS